MIGKLAVLTAVSVGLAVYVGLPWRWFSYHPLLMLLAHLALASAGIAAKRERKGRVNTMMHARAMLLATALSLGGWYVIYRQKQMLGKPHNTSYHSTAGLASIGAFCALSVSGVAGLHPDVGLLRTSGLVRSVHRLGGRAAASVSFAALASGTATIAGAPVAAALSLFLIGIAWTLLASPAGPKSSATSRHAV